ncbi:MAG: NAD(P)/FAD-dependent oxidoreductase [Rhodopseudomonas palustris]|nr:NAD(P)/FAD-dependent oxidoreductase [Rhodopseudomonas palustris]
MPQRAARVTIFDGMAAPGRKFLLAGRGGLNLTHSEPLATFLTRYGAAADWLTPAIMAFPPDALRAWCDGLRQPTFVGSSGRVFPRRDEGIAAAARLARAGWPGSASRSS